MKTEIPITQLLAWRLARAEAEAPRAPSGAQLLGLVRPWWESWPERFQSLVERLSHFQIAYGHAMTDAKANQSGYPVPALIVRADEEMESCVRILYWSVRGGRLRARFQLGSAAQPAPEALDATFVGEKSKKALFCAPAALCIDNEYRVDTELPSECARDWEPLKVIDRMPFRLILRSDKEVG